MEYGNLFHFYHNGEKCQLRTHSLLSVFTPLEMLYLRLFYHMSHDMHQYVDILRSDVYTCQQIIKEL